MKQRLKGNFTYFRANRLKIDYEPEDKNQNVLESRSKSGSYLGVSSGNPLGFNPEMKASQ